MKRFLMLSVLLPAGFLMACEEKVPETQQFTDRAACEAVYDVTTCDRSMAASEQSHEQTAPRYSAQQTCEQQHGPGRCQVRQAADGTSIFMPMMAGFMIGYVANQWMSRPAPLQFAPGMAPQDACATGSPNCQQTRSGGTATGWSRAGGTYGGSTTLPAPTGYNAAGNVTTAASRGNVSVVRGGAGATAAAHGSSGSS